MAVAVGPQDGLAIPVGPPPGLHEVAAPGGRDGGVAMGSNYDKASRELIDHHVQNGFDMAWATQPDDMSEDELEGSLHGDEL